MNHPSYTSHVSAHAAAQGALSVLALQATTNAPRTLAPGHARTLRPARAGELRILRGSAWVTLRANALPARVYDTPRDLFLAAGDGLALRAGQALVLEPIAHDGTPASTVAYLWCNAADASAWSAAVAGPAKDLRRALIQAAHAAAALARGALGWALGSRRTQCAADGTSATPS